LRPAVKLAHTIADSGVPEDRVAFALIKTTNSAAELAAARAYLEPNDYLILDSFIPVSTAYGIAHIVPDHAFRAISCKTP